MPYIALTNIADIEAHYPGVVFDCESKPTLDQVVQWADEATAIIYGAIQDMYVVPVTDTTDRLILKPISDAYVLERVDPIVKPKTIKSAQKTFVVRSTKSSFEHQLDRLLDGTTRLINSTNSSSSYMTYSYTNTNSIEPTSSKEDDIW